jgi:hypothetical protein
MGIAQYNITVSARSSILPCAITYHGTDMAVAPDTRIRPTHTEEAIPQEAFEAIKKRVLQEIDALGNSYHNRFHTEDRVMPACQEYARQARLCPRDAQKLAFGALYHDYGHAGRTYRQLEAVSKMP